MHSIPLPDGESVPSLGLGTWRMGESARSRQSEVAIVRRALELGYRAIDTAELYGDGGAETVVGQAVAQALNAGTLRREELFVVSKVLPHNASRAGTEAACKRSLQRLGLEYVDLYLLHWRGPHPLADTVAAFQALKRQGCIRHWGVSNLDLADMVELLGVRGGEHCAANQLYYALTQRGIEFELLPWLSERRMLCMAYCPIDRGTLASDATLRAIGQRHGATAAQVALAGVLRQPGVMAIPKAVSEAHLRDNLAAAELHLSPQDLADIDRRFPAPTRRQPLAVV